MALLMKLVFVILGLAYLTTANEYTIPIIKTLFNGHLLPIDLRKSVKLIETDIGININFDFSPSNVLNTTVYLANKNKEILAVTFLEGNIVLDRYVTPYLEAEDWPKNIEMTSIHASRADYQVPFDMIPKDITAASASFIAKNSADSEEVIYNYYGIKNYLISLPDRLIYESYMPVNFPNTASEPPQDS